MLCGGIFWSGSQLCMWQTGKPWKIKTTTTINYYKHTTMDMANQTGTYLCWEVRNTSVVINSPPENFLLYVGVHAPLSKISHLLQKNLTASSSSHWPSSSSFLVSCLYDLGPPHPPLTTPSHQTPPLRVGGARPAPLVVSRFVAES